MIGGGPFCFGDRPGLADVCLIPQVFNARRNHVAIDHLPNILKVDQTCSAIDAFRQAHPSPSPTRSRRGDAVQSPPGVLPLSRK